MSVQAFILVIRDGGILRIKDHTSQLFYLMIKISILGLLIGSLSLIACQPQVVLVDVTRVVEITPVGADSAVTVVEAATVVAPVEVVEVTRIVSEEVTRVLTTTVVEEVLVEVTKASLGTAERPIQLLFAPTVNTTVIATRGQVMADALAGATGLVYEVGVVDDEETLIQLLCAAPVDTIGFLTPVGYTIAKERCGVQIGNVAVRSDGLTWQAGMIVTRRDSGLVSLEDLAGKRWAVPDAGSISQSLLFQARLLEAGIEVGEIVEVPGDSNAMLAVYNREVDFATAAFVPPILPFEERSWQYGEDSPENWRRLGIPPRRSPIGYILVNGEPEFGGYRLRDARSRIFDIAPGIYDETRIVMLSDPVPNDTVAFGAEFPLGMARQIISGLVEFVASDQCIQSVCSTDFYGWTGMEPAEEMAYAPLQFLVESLDLTTEDALSP